MLSEFKLAPLSGNGPPISTPRINKMAPAENVGRSNIMIQRRSYDWRYLSSAITFPEYARPRPEKKIRFN
ncbi:hypothetical protein KIF59_08040 [Enterobacter cloacae subsp. cloacae]|nr:hypothetical protein [Enterobacter cloacae subsp. cloacae]